MHSFIDEFKSFAMKGNVIDLAVAVVIGSAFGKIVSSLVANIITPLIGLMMGGIDFSSLSYMVGSSNITYGVFIQAVVDFLIIAFVIFMVIKTINKVQSLSEKEQKEDTKNIPVKPSEEVQLLREIRDSFLTKGT